MLISKETFVEAIKVYQDYYDWEEKLYELDIDLLNAGSLQNLLSSYIELLNLLLEQKRYKLQNTDLEYFIYDVECGKKCDDYYIETADKQIIKWHNAEEFYDYIENSQKPKTEKP